MPEDVTFGIVIKGNAYGHGMVPVAQTIEGLPRISYLLVASLSEAVTLRHAGIKKPILVLSYCDAPLEKAFEYDIHLPVLDEQSAELINNVACRMGKQAQVHVKVDTGLSRLGMHYTTAVASITRIAQHKNIILRGIFTHFSNSESDDLSFAQFQQEQFARIIDQLSSQNITFQYRHTSCSAAITAHVYGLPLVSNMVRLGIGTYGLWPSVENKALTQSRLPSFSLQPVLSWKTKILQIKEVPSGSPVGYDRTHITTRPTKLALLPVGYADGLDRRLSNCGAVLVNGQLAPILGRVAMNVTIIDVTDIAQVSPGDTACLIDNHPRVTATDIAAAIGTIHYEIVTRINPQLPRIITH
jgi:alanine racemase